MSIDSTFVPLSEAKSQLSDLVRRVRTQHEHITLTRNGVPEAVLVSIDDLEGLKMTLEILSDLATVARIKDAQERLDTGDPGVDLATVRAEFEQRRATRKQ